ncbi:hypothetical protein GGS23DRAFT_549494 [Durotheca rogersii]|uniref:uncharacterized protein n=1 Tax=Durotheca rogersii TaxID=419775 RepID=UPI00221F971E|nr:uncharacterized protein GGS23DRAFT_549494 [Durotheca rogersii]KAI5867694.1 hypothetical protein GGS23DRAFT_549494 [Durotheca rogersii]
MLASHAVAGLEHRCSARLAAPGGPGRRRGKRDDLGEETATRGSIFLGHLLRTCNTCLLGCLAKHSPRSQVSLPIPKQFLLLRPSSFRSLARPPSSSFFSPSHARARASLRAIPQPASQPPTRYCYPTSQPASQPTSQRANQPAGAIAAIPLSLPSSRAGPNRVARRSFPSENNVGKPGNLSVLIPSFGSTERAQPAGAMGRDRCHGRYRERESERARKGGGEDLRRGRDPTSPSLLSPLPHELPTHLRPPNLCGARVGKEWIHARTHAHARPAYGYVHIPTYLPIKPAFLAVRPCEDRRPARGRSLRAHVRLPHGARRSLLVEPTIPGRPAQPSQTPTRGSPPKGGEGARAPGQT